MILRIRRDKAAGADDQVVAYAALFLACALLSAAGLGAAAIFCFLPAALVMALGSRLAPPPRRQRA